MGFYLERDVEDSTRGCKASYGIMAHTSTIFALVHIILMGL